MRKLVYIFITVISFNICFAQNESLKFERYREKDGLVHEHVLSILKDSKGFLWIGTYGGVERFNGYIHRKYSWGMDRPTGVINNTFHCIFEDKKGAIWFGTQAGLAKYSWQSDTLSFLSHDAKNLFSISNDNVRCIIEDADGKFWIATYGGGLNMFIPDSNKFYSFKHDSAKSNSLPNNKVNVIFIDSNKNFWVGTEDGGLVLFNKKTKTFKSFYEVTGKKIMGTIINTIYEDKNKNLWIGTWDGGLNYYNPKTNEVKNFKNIEGNNCSLSNNTVRAITGDNKGNIWLATFGGGLNKYDPVLNKFTCYKNDPYDNSAVSQDLIWSLFNDENNILWIGTFGGGLCKYDPENHKFSHIHKQPDYRNTLPSNNISSMFLDHFGVLWVGTALNGISSYNKKTNSVNYYLNNNPNSEQGAMRSFYEDAQHRLWVGTDDGIIVLNEQRQIIKHYKPNPLIKHAISANSVQSITSDKNENMWFGTWSDGVYVLPESEIEKNNTSDAKFINYRNIPGSDYSLSWNIVWVVFTDVKGTVWLGTDKKLDKFNPLTKTFTHYNYQMVNTICENPSGTLWLGTFGFGIYKFDTKKDTAIQISAKEGLPSNIICGVLGDKQNNIWLSTENGIVKFNDQNKTIEIYNENDGLQGSKFNYNAYAIAPDGEIFFGGNNGYNSFYPGNIRKDTSDTKVMFVDLLLYNNSVSFDEAPYGKSILKKQLLFTDTIELLHNQNFFTFKFDAIVYSCQNNIKYRYKLNNFDTTWHYTTALYRQATYTNIDPGNYEFVVNATNRDGKWSNQFAKITIEVIPAWYQTILFKIVSALIFVFAIYLLYFLRLKQITKRNEALEQLIKERTKEIEEKNIMLTQQAEELICTNSLLKERQTQIEEQTEELGNQKEVLLNQRDELTQLNNTKDKLFSILAHDLRGPFNTIIGFSDLLLKNVNNYTIDKITTQVGYIRDASVNTYNLLHNLLQWSRAQQGIIGFEPEKVTISEIIAPELEMLIQQAGRKEIAIKVNSIGVEKQVSVDTNLFNTILRNIMSNAIKYSPKGGIIVMTVNFEDSQLNISVKDQGTGIDDETKKTLFKINKHTSKPGTLGEKGTGLGLILCADFIHKHNGKIWVESEMGKGSIFYFSIPYK
jgi:ligand-binding sensor domain-containing protein/signal transduction histidine kinase